MKIHPLLLVGILTIIVASPSMSESKFDQKQDQPLFMAVKKSDPAFAEAISHAQASLLKFRQLLVEPEHSREAGTIRMVKIFVSEENESMWLWLNVETDEGLGFTASVFEAPPEFPSLKAGTVRSMLDAEVADWAIIDDDGLVNGGFSLRLARSRLPESERASYDSYIGAKTYAPLPSNKPLQATRETRAPEG